MIHDTYDNNNKHSLILQTTKFINIYSHTSYIISLLQSCILAYQLLSDSKETATKDSKSFPPTEIEKLITFVLIEFIALDNCDTKQIYYYLIENKLHTHYTNTILMGILKKYTVSNQKVIILLIIKVHFFILSQRHLKTFISIQQ